MRAYQSQGRDRIEPLAALPVLRSQRWPKWRRSFRGRSGAAFFIKGCQVERPKRHQIGPCGPLARRCSRWVAMTGTVSVKSHQPSCCSPSTGECQPDLVGSGFGGSQRRLHLPPHPGDRGGCREQGDDRRGGAQGGKVPGDTSCLTPAAPGPVRTVL
jgi:hypothetical protein